MAAAMVNVDAREIRALLQRDVLTLLRKLFPRYSITSPVFTPLNPTREDKTPGSFVIWTAGAAAGGFNEYSPRGQARGDVIDLIAYVNRKPGDRTFAFAWARDFLGIRKMSEAQLRHFIAHYERLTRHILAAMPTRADIRIELDAERRAVGLSYRR